MQRRLVLLAVPLLMLSGCTASPPDSTVRTHETVMMGAEGMGATKGCGQAFWDLNTKMTELDLATPAASDDAVNAAELIALDGCVGVSDYVLMGVFFPEALGSTKMLDADVIARVKMLCAGDLYPPARATRVCRNAVDTRLVP